MARTSIGSALFAFAFTITASPLTGQTPRPPAGQPGTVTLSLAEYDRLVDRAGRPRPTLDAPPIPATISRADAVIRVTGDRARGTFTLAGEVFATGVTRVPLVTGAAVVDARIGVASVPLVRVADATIALLEGPKPFVVTLDWGATVTSSPGRAVLAVPVPPAGIVSAAFELPAAAADIQLQGGAIARTTPTPASTRVEATLVPGSEVRISWAARRTEGPAARNARTIASVRTLLSFREADTHMTSLIELSVLAGQPDRVEIDVPPGFSFAGVSGASVEVADEAANAVSVRLTRPLDRRHQMLATFERQSSMAGTFEVQLPHVKGAEREAGEIALEAAGTVDLRVSESAALHRIDVRESSPALLSMAGPAVLAALRYQRRGEGPLVVAGDLTRFPDASVITAAADRAVVTTLVTVDGRTLTEVALTLRNRAQPYLRVELPAGASMVSAEVAGEPAKLALAPDGARVPLLRPGFRPNGAYAVSFVYVQPGQPLLKKGRAELTLPKMDVPIGLVEWEMFVPDRYRVRDFQGDARLEPAPDSPAPLASTGSGSGSGSGRGFGRGVGGGVAGGTYSPAPGQIVGRVTDAAGAPIPGARIVARRNATVIAETVANDAGWYLLSEATGRLTLSAELEGFTPATRQVRVDSSQPPRYDLVLEPGPLNESIRVAIEGERGEREARDEAAQSPSQNVFNLQRRVEGVLPVRIDVPRAGAAYRFVRPLVVDETTRVSFDYRRR